MVRIITTIMVAKYITQGQLAYVDCIEDDYELARAEAQQRYPASEGYAHLYPGDPRLWFKSIRWLVPLRLSVRVQDRA